MAKTVLSFKGLKYTAPVVKTSLAVRKAEPGDIFEIVCDYPGFERDIRVWCEETGNILEGVARSNGDTTVTVVKKQ
jgi:tRNA 2-thiouridine synthesizing protein A